MQVVNKGVLYGHPDQDWMMGAKVGDPHPALVLDRWIEPDTPYGPIYFVQPTVETMGRQFGMLTKDEADALREKVDESFKEILDLEQKLGEAERTIEYLKGTLASLYQPSAPVEEKTDTPAEVVYETQPVKRGPGRPRKVTA